MMKQSLRHNTVSLKCQELVWETDSVTIQMESNKRRGGEDSDFQYKQREHVLTLDIKKLCEWFHVQR